MFQELQFLVLLFVAALWRPLLAVRLFSSTSTVLPFVLRLQLLRELGSHELFDGRGRKHIGCRVTVSLFSRRCLGRQPVCTIF